MKKSLVFVFVLVTMLVFSAVAMAASVEPITVKPWQSGNAANECALASQYTGVDYMYATKIDNWEGVGTTYSTTAVFADGHSNTINITNNDGTYFDWSATPNPIGAVIVKGGSGANIFAYNPQAFSDTSMYSPVNDGGNLPEVSHATFCWNPEESMCFEDETGWAAGSRYVNRGNWATFTPYAANNVVTLYAGQSMEAGTVTFSEVDGNGEVTIAIQLNAGWYFGYEDPNGTIQESVHIQGYETAPSGNPAPGLFEYKYPAMGQYHQATVAADNFYGVHVALQHQVDCQ